MDRDILKASWSAQADNIRSLLKSLRKIRDAATDNSVPYEDLIDLIREESRAHGL